ncbi:hypothetical protein D3C75_615990 [compost metagenome]
MTDVHNADNHCTKAQALRLVSALRSGPVTTLEAAQALDIVHPPSTIRWLRNRGFSIRTEWTYAASGSGRRPHRIGCYVLLGEPIGAAALES